MVLAKLYVAPWEAIGVGVYFVVAGFCLLKWRRPMARWMARNYSWGVSRRTIERAYGSQDEPKVWLIWAWGGGCVAGGLLLIVVGIAG